MDKSHVILKLAELPEEDARLSVISGVLDGTPENTQGRSLRLLRICEAARESGLSRSTIYRCIAAGVLRPFEIRPGAAPRILESDLMGIGQEARAERSGE